MELQHRTELAQTMYQWFISPQASHLCKMYQQKNLVQIRINQSKNMIYCRTCFSTEHPKCNSPVCSQCYSPNHSKQICTNDRLPCKMCTINNEPDMTKYAQANIIYTPHWPYKCPLYTKPQIVLFPTQKQTSVNETLHAAHSRQRAYVYANTEPNSMVPTYSSVAATNTTNNELSEYKQQLNEMQLQHMQLSTVVQHLQGTVISNNVQMVTRIDNIEQNQQQMYNHQHQVHTAITNLTHNQTKQNQHIQDIKHMMQQLMQHRIDSPHTY